MLYIENIDDVDAIDLIDLHYYSYNAINYTVWPWSSTAIRCPPSLSLPAAAIPIHTKFSSIKPP